MEKSIEERLEVLEGRSAVLEPDSEERRGLREEIIAYTEEFIEKMEENPAFFKPEKGVEDELTTIDPNSRMGMRELLSRMKRTLDYQGINPAGPGHLGYIPGGGIYLSSLADYWAAITNRYAGVYFANPGAVRIENKLIRWMAERVGYPAEAHGNLASGGSIANLTAIVTARETQGITSEKIPRACIYMTRQVHHSISKALLVAGLQECRIQYVEMDEAYRMDMDKLERQIEIDREEGGIPFLLVGSAGTTDVGAIDPLDRMAAIARRENLWFHIDAAYGGFFVITEEGKRKFSGMELSDSVVIDPHKGMFLPYGLGICLVRNGEDMQRAFTFQASYLQDISSANEEINPMDVSPEMTKHFRGLRMWLPLLVYGEEPFISALEEKLLLARYFYNRIREIRGFETELEPQLSVVTFRYVPGEGDVDDFNRKIMEEVHRDGRVFFSSTTVNGKFMLRLAILAYRTHRNTIDLTLEMLQEKVATLLKRDKRATMSD